MPLALLRVAVAVVVVAAVADRQATECSLLVAVAAVAVAAAETLEPGQQVARADRPSLVVVATQSARAQQDRRDQVGPDLQPGQDRLVVLVVVSMKWITHHLLGVLEAVAVLVVTMVRQVAPAPLDLVPQPVTWEQFQSPPVLVAQVVLVALR